MKYLTVMGTEEMGSTLSLYHLNPANIIFIQDMGTFTVSMTSNTAVNSPICEIALSFGRLYVSGVAEELIARMS